MRRRPISGAGSPNVEKLTVVRGINIPQQSPTMDRFLAEEDVDVLYERWQDEWPAPISLQGGGRLVTTAMVRELTWQQLSGTYGAKRAKLYRDIARAQV